ncbi:hypothetical protein SAMN05444274_102161 [Mariniphaga anaerophila]|uniref:Uncharacterized protein n=1 Tax=Mariniphaga anaerophila TaxID=1484053 RepID=A0A1M4VPF5_9BACT|nr:hypothetical protein [Mariniphaga anaerophila]SHE70723.1 hypothetical protein SAMN05444274_102161 [Mariniphaga anaerophila]
MKKYFAYIIACVMLVAAGCTDFGEETQLTLPGAPAVEITGITPGDKGDDVTFTVKPAGTAGYYSWVIIESEKVDTTILEAPDRVLKQQVTGVKTGITEYAKAAETSVTVEKLTPFTIYQIYAVASSVDGVDGEVKNAQFRTLDDGSKPTPQKIAVADTTVTLTFHEPLNLGTGKVFVSYFAKNTVSGDKPLVIEPGYEEFNPQDIEIPAEGLSVSGNDLMIELPNAPAGAYASITYEEGAVLDLEGNGSSAYTAKADTLISGAPSRGLTTRVAVKAWNLRSEFEDLNPDTVATFAEWEDLVIPALTDEGIVVAKKVADAIPTVVYKQPGKVVTLDVAMWGLMNGVPVFLLPEEPARGATVDIAIPANAFEDVYGNTNIALDIQDNYLYSYGYTLDDIVGTYRLDGYNASTGAPIVENDITIVADEESDDENAVLIKGLGMNLFGIEETTVAAIFDPVGGTLTVPDWQVLAVDWIHPSVGTPADIFFSTYNSPAIIFAVPQPGTVTSANDVWGYYLAKDETAYGALRWYDPSSTFVRTDSKSATIRGQVLPETDFPILKEKKVFSK